MSYLVRYSIIYFSEGLCQERMRIVLGKEKYKKKWWGYLKRLFGYRFERDYNIKMYVKELKCKGVGWIRMILDKIKR